MSRRADVLVVGAGFAGATCARALADAGLRVRLIDRRPHAGGNAWDRRDEHGILVHPYGPHIFHTNSDEVLAWLSRFTCWRAYEHHVLASIDGKTYPIPINRTTINRFYGLALREDEVFAFLESVREPRDPIRTSEDVVLNSVGRRLCDAFFRGYTRKQWGRDLEDLAAGVAARIPVRSSDDDRYFSDKHQCMPADGYAELFESMLRHPHIELELSCEFRRGVDETQVRHTVYTGPIDAFYDCRYGQLAYRSLRFEHFHVPEVAPSAFVQPAPVINYPCEFQYTRITEFKQLTGQIRHGSSLVREFPTGTGDPYYPIPCAETEELYRRYRDLADTETDVSFVGRLAQYRYYNMDQVVAAALLLARSLANKLSAPAAPREVVFAAAG